MLLIQCLTVTYDKILTMLEEHEYELNIFQVHIY